MPYVDPNQNVAVWANQTLFKDFLTPKTTTGATAPATTPSTTVAIPGGPEFKTPTAAEIAANQNAYSTAALGAYGGMPIIQQQLTGQLPRDVQANINQMGAERGIATGMPGSPNANAATMKALGLTSLGLQQQGLENLNRAYQTFPQLNPLGISQQNLEAWRTGTQYQERALSENARAALEWELNQIRANTALTQQQREYAMQQARNKAYASALQPYLDQYGQPMASMDPFGGPGSRESNLAAGQNDMYNNLLDAGFSPDEAQFWLQTESTQGTTGLPSGTAILTDPFGRSIYSGPSGITTNWDYTPDEEYFMGF